MQDESLAVVVEISFRKINLGFKLRCTADRSSKRRPCPSGSELIGLIMLSNMITIMNSVHGGKPRACAN